MDQRLMAQLDWLDQDEARRRALLIEQHQLSHGVLPTDTQLAQALAIQAPESGAQEASKPQATPWEGWIGGAALAGLGVSMGWGWLGAHAGLAPDIAASAVPWCGAVAAAALTGAGGCLALAWSRSTATLRSGLKRAGLTLGICGGLLGGTLMAEPVTELIQQSVLPMHTTVVRYQMFRLSTDQLLAIEPGKDWRAMTPLTPTSPSCQVAVHQLDLLAEQPLDPLGLSMQMGAEETVFRRGCLTSAALFSRMDALADRGEAQHDVLHRLPFMGADDRETRGLPARAWCQLSPEWAAGTPDATIRHACLGPQGQAPEGPRLHHAVPLKDVLAP